MIHFVLAKSNSKTIRHYINNRGKAIKEHIGIIHYEDLYQLQDLKTSALIFSDFDRLTQAQIEKVKLIYRQIQQAHPNLLLMNDPSKVLLRYDLLKEMHRRGINHFNVFRLNEPLDEMKFPIFLREENDHTGGLTKLIYDSKSMQTNILALQLLGYRRSDLIAVEFVDVADEEGNYRKYSAMKAGELQMARQLDYGRTWNLKTNMRHEEDVIEQHIQEYQEYIKSDPDREWLAEVFEIGGFDYGRADYGVIDGRRVLWEINLNPYFGRGRYKSSKQDPRVRAIKQGFHDQFKEYLMQLNARPVETLDISLEEGLTNLFAEDKLNEWRRSLLKNFHTKKQPKKKILMQLRALSLGLASALLPMLKPLGYRAIPR